MDRRGLMKTVLVACATVFLPASVNAGLRRDKYRRVGWTKLDAEPLAPGDFWASDDPNTPERQGESDFNLQMQAVHSSYCGAPANTIGCNSGGYWRPVVIIAVVS